MEMIKAFERADIPEVVDLRRRVFRSSAWQGDDGLASYFETVFFNNPWARPDIPSLVYKTNGQIVGFVGVLPRPFAIGSERRQGIVISQFMVDAEYRGATGGKLLHEALNGPQDFSISDVANKSAQRVWERVGGRVSRFQSLFWSYALRPTRASTMQQRHSKAARALQISSGPVVRAIDFLRTRSMPFWSSPPGAAETISMRQFAHYSDVVAGSVVLRPVHTEQSLEWLGQRIAEKWPNSQVRRLIIKQPDAAVAGCLIYLLHPNKTADVLALVTVDNDAAKHVIAHMLHDAYSQGAVRIRGRMESRCLDVLTGPGFRLERGSRGLLVHSRDQELYIQLMSGDAVLSGLDGEWWMNF